MSRRKHPRLDRASSLLEAAALGGAGWLLVLSLGGCGGSQHDGRPTGGGGISSAPDASSDSPAGGSGGSSNGGEPARASGGSPNGGEPARASGGSPNGGGGGATDLPDASPTDLPTAPPWQPGFPLAPTGWRGSTTPLCSKPVGGTASRLWSKTDAVYALVTTECAGMVDDSCNIPIGSASQILYENDGTGWRSLYRRAVSTGSQATLLGYPDGHLVIAGDTGSTAASACDAVLVQPSGQSTCIYSGQKFGASAGATLAADVLLMGRYTDAQTATKLLKYDGSSWTEIGSWPWPGEIPTALAAAGSAALVVGGAQLAWAGDTASGTLAPLSGVPAGDYTAAWIYGLSDIYLGNAIGQLTHFDGKKWTTVETGLEQILRLWGAPDGAIFAYSATRLVRLKAGTATTVWQFDGDASQTAVIMDIWGNSSTEVFFAVKDFAFAKYACGPTFLLWFDGSAVHRF